jgi:hypothetical protein
METTVAWILLLVTAYSSDDFDFEKVGAYNTVAECHVAATQTFWEVLPMNTEVVCIRTEGFVDETNIP